MQYASGHPRFRDREFTTYCVRTRRAGHARSWSSRTSVSPVRPHPSPSSLRWRLGQCGVACTFTVPCKGFGVGSQHASAVSSPGFTTPAGGSAAPPRSRVLARVHYLGRRQRRPASQACSAVSSPRLTTPAGGSAAPPRRLARPRIATAHAHTVCRRCLFAILTLYAFLCQMAAAAAPAAANAPAPHAVEPWHYWDNNYRVVDLDTIAALSGVTWSKRSLSKREKSEELHAAGLAASGARPNRPAPASPLPPKVRKRGNTLSALPPPSHARTA